MYFSSTNIKKVRQSRLYRNSQTITTLSILISRDFLIPLYGRKMPTASPVELG